jgi:SH3-like domain-containing protein
MSKAQRLPSTATTSVGSLYHVGADKTPSGFAVPRFVSLKFGKVNARTGPSRNHSIAYQYQRRGLPVIVVAETEMWRKIRDISGDEAWVRKPALSGEKFAVLTTEATLYAKPDASARSLARIEKGALVQLETCSGDGYCLIRTGNGIKGFTDKHALWGAQNID